MRTLEKIAFSAAVKTLSPLSAILGADIYELDANQPIRLGAFSKPRSKLTGSPIQALRDAIAIRQRDPKVGDLLVRPRSWPGYPNPFGWQVWERRRVCGRVMTSGGDSRARRTSDGNGTIFLL